MDAIREVRILDLSNSGSNKSWWKSRIRSKFPNRADLFITDYQKVREFFETFIFPSSMYKIRAYARAASPVYHFAPFQASNAKDGLSFFRKHQKSSVGHP